MKLFFQGLNPIYNLLPPAYPPAHVVTAALTVFNVAKAYQNPSIESAKAVASSLGLVLAERMGVSPRWLILPQVYLAWQIAFPPLSGQITVKDVEEMKGPQDLEKVGLYLSFLEEGCLGELIRSYSDKQVTSPTEKLNCLTRLGLIPSDSDLSLQEIKLSLLPPNRPICSNLGAIAKAIGWECAVELLEMELKQSPQGMVSLNLSALRDIDSIPDSIRCRTDIEQLDLSNIRMPALPDWVGELQSLRELNLSNCTSLENLSAINHCESLTGLNLSCCWGLSVEELSKVISKLKSLKTLVLSHLDFSSLPDWIQHLPHLIQLDLSECAGLENLPEWLKELKNLRELNISGCDRLPTDLPAWILNMPDLKVIR